MRSHLDALQTTTSVDLRRFADNFHSVAKQASFSAAFKSEFIGLGAVWEVKMEATIGFWGIFWRCFFRMRSGIDFGSFFGGLKPEKSLKTQHCSMFFANFHNIDIFEKVVKQKSILASFSEVKTTKNRETIVLQIMYFFNVEF